MKSAPSTTILKIALFGNNFTGKTTLLYWLIHNEFRDFTYSSSIGLHFDEKDFVICNKSVSLHIYSANETFRQYGINRNVFQTADCIVFILDITDNETFETLNEWIDFKERRETKSAKAPVVLIGNKMDKEEKRKISKKQAKLWCFRNSNHPYYEVSAKCGTNVDKTFEEIANIAFKWNALKNLYTEKKKDYYINVFKFVEQSVRVAYEKVCSTDSFKHHIHNNLNLLPKFITFNNNNKQISVVGIDLGTTRCCAAVNRKNGIETVALENTGNRLLPSFVAFDEENVKCGEIVLNRMQYYEKWTVFDSKRIIGKSYDDINVDSSWMFSISKIFDRAKIEINDRQNGVTFKFPEEVSAALLKHIKTECENFQGKKLTEAVITIPASFDDAQIEATYASALLAGWEKIHFFLEPVAAAFAYFADRSVPVNSNLLVFDLGGGTLDVCIFKIVGTKLSIITRSGDPNLGGRDFDNILIDYFREKLLLKYAVTVAENKKYKLMQKCQEIKHNLSDRNEDMLDVEDFDLSKEDSYITITRKRFEGLAGELFKKIQKNIDSALQASGLQTKDINQVLYVGGGCRMPAIKDLLLKKTFPHAEHCYKQNPDEVVAIGAAFYAYYLQLPQNKNRCSVI